jgi:tetratricopeptide (TPR) repeat protein
MRQILLIFKAAWAVGLMQSTAVWAAADVPACEARYEAAQTTQALKAPGTRALQMERTGSACFGTGMFDVWLAADYLAAGDMDSTARVVERALAKTSNARPNLLHLLVEVDLKRGLVDQAVKKGEAIAATYPQYSPIQYGLAGIAMNRQDWPLALAHARKAYEVEGSALALLSMATALHQLKRHEETVAAVRRALEMEPQRISRIGGVLEGVFSLAILNRRAEAADLARRHIAANPNWRANAMFARASEELGVFGTSP